VKVNWNDAEKSEIVPDAKYLCKVQKVVLKKTKKTGEDMWTVWLAIQDEGPLFGKVLFHNLVFGPRSLWMVKTFYEACRDEEPTGEEDLSTSDLLDYFVIVTVKGKNDFGPILTYFENPSKNGEIKTTPRPEIPAWKSDPLDPDDIPF
jgi:hypothetical protein